MHTQYLVTRCFYFSLGNIHPKYRSTLSSIQLLALVKVEVLHVYGMDRALEPIVHDIQKLEEVNQCSVLLYVSELQ